MQSYVFMEKTQPWPIWWLLAVCAMAGFTIIGSKNELIVQFNVTHKLCYG